VVEWIHAAQGVLTNEIARGCAAAGTPLTRAHVLVGAGRR
jgi:hypothetical protein